MGESMMVPGAAVRSGWDHYFEMLVNRRKEESTPNMKDFT